MAANRDPRRRSLVVAAALAVVAAGSSPAAARDGDAVNVTALARLFEGNPHRIALKDPYAFVALDSGLTAFDVRDPANPVRLSHLYLDSAALDLDLDGNYAYVAADEQGLVVVDVRDPASLLVVAVLPIDGARAIDVQGAFAYVAAASHPPARSFGLQVVDLATPLAPRLRGFLALANGPLAVNAAAASSVLAGTGTELGNPSRGLAAIDATDPDNPVLRGFLATGRAVNAIARAGSRAFLATGFPASGELVVADVSGALPGQLGSLLLPDGLLGIALDPAGTTAFLAARSLGLVVADVSNPGAPVAAGALATHRETVGVATRGDLTLLAERASIEQASFTAVDTRNAKALRELSASAYAEATAAAAGAGRAYLLERDGLFVFDTSVSGSPLLIGRHDPAGADFSALDVEGSIAAVAEGDVVHLLDVSGVPVPIGDAFVTGVAVRPVLAGPDLYVVNGSGLEVFSVAAPTAAIGTFTTPGWSSGFALQGTLGYLAAGSTLHVIDLINPAAPAAIGQLTIPGEQLHGLALDPSRRLLVLTGLDATLHVVDIANPASPALAFTLPGPGGSDVKMTGDRAVVAAEGAGVIVVEVPTGSAPRVDGSLDTAGRAVAVAALDDALFVATLDAQQWWLRCDTCFRPCVETWPTIAPNSLRAVRGNAASPDVFSWAIASGSGSTNIHRTLDERELPTLYAIGPSYVDFAAGTSYGDVYDPPAGPAACYQVYGRGSCSTVSHAP